MPRAPRPPAASSASAKHRAVGRRRRSNSCSRRAPRSSTRHGASGLRRHRAILRHLQQLQKRLSNRTTWRTRPPCARSAQAFKALDDRQTPRTTTRPEPPPPSGRSASTLRRPPRALRNSAPTSGPTCRAAPPPRSASSAIVLSSAASSARRRACRHAARGARVRRPSCSSRASVVHLQGRAGTHAALAATSATAKPNRRSGLAPSTAISTSFKLTSAASSPRPAPPRPPRRAEPSARASNSFGSSARFDSPATSSCCSHRAASRTPVERRGGFFLRHALHARADAALAQHPPSADTSTTARRRAPRTLTGSPSLHEERQRTARRKPIREPSASAAGECHARFRLARRCSQSACCGLCATRLTPMLASLTARRHGAHAKYRRRGTSAGDHRRRGVCTSHRRSPSFEEECRDARARPASSTAPRLLQLADAPQASSRPCRRSPSRRHQPASPAFDTRWSAAAS